MHVNDANGFVNFILSSNYTTFVSNDLNIDVSQQFLDEMKLFEAELEKLSAMEDLKMSQPGMIQLLNQIYEMIGRFGTDMSTTNPPTQMSKRQAAFIDRILQCVLTIQYYYSLLDQIPVINEAYAKLTGLALIKELHSDTLESLFNTSGKAGFSEFMSTVTRHTAETYDVVQGIDDVREQVKATISSAILVDNGYVFIIMAGPPGTGKSTLSHCIASDHSRGNYYNFHIAELSSATVGQTEKNIVKLFESIEKSTEPVTIIFDEMDNIFANGTADPAHIRSVKTTLQTEISGGRQLKNNVVLVGLTNYLDRIEDAIKRRTTSIIYVPLPGKQAAAEFLFRLLGVEMAHLKHQFQQQIYQMLNLPDKNYTNATIKSLVKNAKNAFIVRQNGFFDASLYMEAAMIIRSNVLAINTNWQRISLADMKMHAMAGKQIIFLPELVDFETALANVYVLDDRTLAEYKARNKP